MSKPTAWGEKPVLSCKIGLVRSDALNTRVEQARGNPSGSSFPATVGVQMYWPSCERQMPANRVDKMGPDFSAGRAFSPFTSKPHNTAHPVARKKGFAS